MFQVLINGLLLGANYALLAVGYSLIFGVMHLLTLAHGEVFMAAGLVALLLAGSGTPIWLALLYALVVGAVLGALTEILAFHPVGYSRHMAAAVSTIGFSIAIQNAILQWRGSSTPVAVAFFVPETDLRVGSLLVSSVQLASLGLALLLMVATEIFVRRSRWGMAMRAIAHDPEMAGLLGVPVRRLGLLVTVIAGGLAGIAAFLLALRNGSLSPLAGLDTGLKGLAVMTIGGLGSLPGAMIAGLGLGLVEAYTSYFGLLGYQAAIPWAVLILILLIRRPPSDV